MTEEEWLAAESPLPLLIYLRGTAPAENPDSRKLYCGYGDLVAGESAAMPPQKVRFFIAALLRRLSRIELDDLSKKAVEAYLAHAYFGISSDKFSSVCYEIQNNLQSDPRPLISHMAAYMWTDDPLGAANASGDIACTLAYHEAADSIAVTCADADDDDWFEWGFGGPPDEKWQNVRRAEESHHADLIRDLIPNPFQPHVDLASSPPPIDVLARRIYNLELFDEMVTLGAVLQDAGYTSESVIDHCLNQTVHVRGCWVLDSILSHTESETCDTSTTTMFKIPVDFEWLNPWVPIDDPDMCAEFGPLFGDPIDNSDPIPALIEELHREMPVGHILYGLSVNVVAFCAADHNEFLFVTDEPSKPIAHVHLTWSIESDPKWPHTTIYRTLDEWAAQMKREHDGYTS